MKESTLIESVNALFVFAFLFLINGVSIYVNEEHKDRAKDRDTKQERFQERKTPEPVIDYKRNLEGARDLMWTIDRLDIYYDSIEYEYIGSYFITAYCPHECGYVEYSDGTDNFPRGWITASDTICHYSESNWEPTTCAIDRRYFGFNEYLAIDFDGTMKVYVTEDTGAFSGRWIDCFVETMYEVETWDTSWKDCYSVEYRMNTCALHQDREKRHEFINDYLHYRCFGTWLPDRSDIRDFRRFRTDKET